MENKVVLGLSGGVDSALAARMLCGSGFQVSCVYLDNGVGDPEPARRAARELGLRLDVIDIRPALDALVCQPFRQSYLEGRTPSPCPLCNHAVKFPALIAVADELHAPWVATGHYARAKGGQLFRAVGGNDQSYMLARLTKAQLARCLFPLGDYEKSRVRAMAEEAGLTAAHTPDSMELCFVPDGDYAAWLERQGPTPPPGDFVDAQGHVLGRHQGIHRYTLGQGSGLGISGPHKYYVSAIRVEENQVVVSDGSDLYTSTVRATGLNLLAPKLPPEATVRFRHSRTETPAQLEPQADGSLLIRAHTPVRAPTPGQLAVFYAGERVLGSGWIL